QAEDGIRDPLVTGVQTCALPISKPAGADSCWWLMRLLAAHSRSVRGAAERSVTLLRVFLGASAFVLAVGALVLSTILTHSLTAQSLADHQQSLTQYVDGVLRPTIVHGDSLRVDPRVSSVLRGELRPDRDLVTVKVRRPD